MLIFCLVLAYMFILIVKLLFYNCTSICATKAKVGVPVVFVVLILTNFPAGIIVVRLAVLVLVILKTPLVEFRLDAAVTKFVVIAELSAYSSVTVPAVPAISKAATVIFTE